MRPLNKRDYKNNETEYKPYGRAKDDLINAIGDYCSYCERNGFSSALDVEHIEDKKNNPSLKYIWDNFLLACKNCNSIKSTKNFNKEEIILPHIDNTFKPITYLESGYIQASISIDKTLLEKTNKLIELVGLDRVPGHQKYSNKDKRWEERKKVWELSKRYLVKYKKGECDKETIKDLALSNGFWSIWMNTFNDYENIKQELINTFKGTAKLMF